MTPDAAEERLNELALDAENENYHTVAEMIWDDVIPFVAGLTERAVIVLPLEFKGVETFVVEPV